MKEPNEFSVILEIDDPEKQGIIKKFAEELDEVFSFAKFSVEFQTESLTPLEITATLVITIVAEVTAELIIKMFEKLWEKLEKNEIQVKVKDVDVVERKAENYLKHIGVENPVLIEKKIKGVYDLFIFRDASGNEHVLHISSCDLRIINYKKRCRHASFSR